MICMWENINPFHICVLHCNSVNHNVEAPLAVGRFLFAMQVPTPRQGK